MREIVLDTETTGFEPSEGHRLVEIGCVELINHMPTGNTYHQYINPERGMPAEAFAVHGLGDDFLRPQPKFAQVAQAFVDFVAGAKLVIHNAAFDMKFLNTELEWIGKPKLENPVVDTLAIARRKFPGASASLDALCRRFGIDNSNRTLHGALLDSEILAEVYLELLGGRQTGLALNTQNSRSSGPVDVDWRARPRPTPLPSRLTEEELAAHAKMIAGMGDAAIWRKYDA
ncbi:DNA polymerase III subunit epsilon [Pararhodobacter zhoushanensis]|uniref:DNA polymerase III subunit epsilon n=1 Tax=Pararhodobacter zhoushanensis TaxID=2479545 RepID=UPI000F8E6810|nr:DNA polymerase III subunit epsilon [Pararhodobacter zhoushanensis]